MVNSHIASPTGVKLATPTQSRIVRFALFEVDLETGELRKSGMRQKIAGQPFEVLRVLLERPQEIVTREDLQQRIWPADTFVDYDLALRKAVTRLREVLGDSAESPRFIETVPRKGYRFIAPLSTNGDAVSFPELPAATSTRPPRYVSIAILLGVAAIALLLAGLGFMTDQWHRLVGMSAPPQIRSIAVLPLQNLSADPSQEYFSDGLTDALITELAQIGSFRVISRTSTVQYKRTAKPLPQIARELNVDAIVEGTVQRSGDEVRVSAQLIEAASDHHVWAASYDRSLSDVFTLERNLTAEIAGEIRGRLTTEARARLATPQPVNPKALEAYWQGRYHERSYEAGSGDEAKKKSAEWFQQAIAADPNFALAYVGLAEAHFRLSPAEEDLDIIMSAAEKAVALDPGLAHAHVVLGEAYWAAGRWKEAEHEFRRGIALNPNDVGSHSSLVNILDVTGRFDEGWKEAEIVRALDPKPGHMAWPYYRRRQYDRAIEVLQISVKSHAGSAYDHWSLAQNYLQKRMTKEWIAEVGAYMASVGFPEVTGHLQRAAAVGGYRGALRQWTKELERLHARGAFYWPGVLAQAYAMLGDKERAFYWLEDAYTHRRQSYNDPYLWGRLRIDPGFDSLRADPRYENLMSRLGLPL